MESNLEIKISPITETTKRTYANLNIAQLQTLLNNYFGFANGKISWEVSPNGEVLSLSLSETSFTIETNGG